ncbi:hypothetical protein Bbelb_390670 [Branchiostoma belcheri]|nr:hypothetical protein Bbelb_390670 [Branchiostoma belcheri]
MSLTQCQRNDLFPSKALSPGRLIRFYERRRQEKWNYIVPLMLPDSRRAAHLKGPAARPEARTRAVTAATMCTESPSSFTSLCEVTFPNRGPAGQFLVGPKSGQTAYELQPNFSDIIAE